MKTLIALLILTLFLAASSAHAERHLAMPRSLADLNYLTEEYYPFNYSENGRLKGFSVDLLQHGLGCPRSPPETNYPASLGQGI